MKNFNKALLIVSSLLVFSSQAAETDQFYASSAVIRDSKKEMNDYFHGRIEFALDAVNSETPNMSCRYVAKEVLDHVLGKFNLVKYIKERDFSKVSVFTQTSPLIDRFPEDTVSEKFYRAHSIYENRPFPVNIVGVARTINLDGIYMGTDKMGHFSIVGRTYYKNFLKGLEDGLSEDEAQTAAIKKGFKQEVAILGYAVGGTLSFGDLEANYQGLQFGRQMCEGKKPYLVKVNGKWTHNPENQFDIARYVNPKFDEAFNVSFWSPRMWRKMKDQITRDYCKNKSDLNYQARYESYLPRVKSTINDDLIAAFVKEKPKYDRQKQLLQVSCESL